MSRKKKYVLENVHIESYAAEGKCIAHHNEKVIFVEGVVPGDIATIFVHKNKKDWAEAKVNAITRFSPQRVDPFCHHFEICGGCKWQMLPYDLQLKYKEQQVKDQLKRIGHVDVKEYLPIVGCVEDRLYRNKLEFTFSNKQYLSSKELATGMSFEKNVLGFHAPRLFDKVIDITTCHLQEEPTNAIKNFIRDFAISNGTTFYDIKAHQGLLRNLIIRMSSIGEILVNIIFAEHQPAIIKPFMEAIKQAFPEITSLNYTINTKANDTIYDLEVINYSGKDFIHEKLEDFIFKISPKSFFQTNTKQAERLYCIVRDFAGASGNEILYDLYCGTGSIGIFLSKKVKQIIGVESVDDSILDARINAAANNLTNTSFYTGDVIKICDDDFFKQHGKPDIIIIDPPRAGCHEKLIQKLLEIKAPRIVYVSCNPATQARDLKLMADVYSIEKSQAVDMFPQTHHVENVVQLNLK